jgi:chromosome segregation ATPase
MNIAQGMDMEAFEAQQQATLKQMSKGKLIKQINKMEEELTAYREQVKTMTARMGGHASADAKKGKVIESLKKVITSFNDVDGWYQQSLDIAKFLDEKEWGACVGDTMKSVQDLKRKNDDLKKNEEVREKLIIDLKNEVGQRADEEDEVVESAQSQLKALITEGMGQKEFEAWLLNPQERRGEFFQTIAKQHNDFSHQVQHLTAEKKDLKNEIGALRLAAEHQHRQNQVNPRPAREAPSHLEGYQKLVRLIHEADPVTGMW